MPDLYWVPLSLPCKYMHTVLTIHVSDAISIHQPDTSVFIVFAFYGYEIGKPHQDPIIFSITHPAPV